jgi:hypothetical protein
MLFGILSIFVSFSDCATGAEWGHEARLRLAVRVQRRAAKYHSPVMAVTA